MTNWCGSRSQTDTATGTCHGTRVKPLAAGASRASVRRSATVGRVYGWFTEGLDTLDLKEAKALLDELPIPPRLPRDDARNPCDISATSRQSLRAGAGATSTSYLRDSARSSAGPVCRPKLRAQLIRPTWL
jgi:hypothetical protein